jgi:hypothetical protein
MEVQNCGDGTEVANGGNRTEAVVLEQRWEVNSEEVKLMVKES